MQSYRTVKRHAILVDKMAETLGIDLEEEVMRGDLPFEAVTDAVLACSACSNPDDCEIWLEKHKSGAAAAPRYCRNAEMFRVLKGG